MAPVPRRRLGPLAITAIVVGSVLTLGALGRMAHTGSGHDTVPRASASDPGRTTGGEPSAPTSSSSGRYRLTLPSSLLGGRYTLNEDISREVDQGIVSGAGGRSSADEREIKGAGAWYSAAAAPDGTQLLLVSGFYGDIVNPASSLASTFAGMNETPGVTVTSPPREVTPPGADQAVTCERYEVVRSGTTRSTAVCGWGDHSTVGTVSAVGSAASAGFDELATQTLAIRNQVRTPLT
ncbi:hypothetical protein LE181_02275 [Streptomyces sp. SCA3-4]|uniref:hypothetical protein n=1 Tax=Streptomyces sichuanensis TaxID=2871810 RepID=UPI001CE3794B|nr:hypothetical protein [Streptomyces sichuanensis]MCA6091000.1 hypothetical protein [Streptomyces sichuanensis]